MGREKLGEREERANTGRRSRSVTRGTAVALVVALMASIAVTGVLAADLYGGVTVIPQQSVNEYQGQAVPDPNFATQPTLSLVSSPNTASCASGTDTISTTQTAPWVILCATGVTSPAVGDFTEWFQFTLASPLSTYTTQLSVTTVWTDSGAVQHTDTGTSMDIAVPLVPGDAAGHFSVYIDYGATPPQNIVSLSIEVV